jgi:hypothetical protein
MTGLSAKAGAQPFVEVRAHRAFLAVFLIAAVCGQAFGLHQYVPTPTRQTQQHRTIKRRAHVRRLRWNPVFRPSHESLLLQNAEIDRMDLPRIHDDAELRQLVASGDLVPIEESESLRIEHRLDPSRRYCRPWTRDFLEDFSQAYYQQFHSQIQVNSAVRTVLVQKKLRRHNRNAAPVDGDTASSHLAGITVDVQRRGMTRQQVKWVENYLMPLKEQGLIEPEEERHQWVFHIAVSGRYADLHAPKTVASEQNEEVPDLGLIEFPPQRVSDTFNSNR